MRSLPNVEELTGTYLDDAEDVEALQGKVKIQLQQVML